MRRIFPSVFVWLLVCAPAGAQTLGTITGEVKDASGAVIPGATVTATNTGTNATREMPSNEAGAYSVSRAAARARTSVKAELQGFQTVDAEGRAARRGDRPRRLHDGDRHAVGDSRGHGRRAAHHDRERDGRHRHREPTHRRAAAERAQLSVARRARARTSAPSSRAPGRPAIARAVRAPTSSSRFPASGASSTTTRSTARTTPTSTSILTFCCRRSTRSKSSRCRRASTRPSSAARPAR